MKIKTDLGIRRQR